MTIERCGLVTSGGIFCTHTALLAFIFAKSAVR